MADCVRWTGERAQWELTAERVHRAVVDREDERTLAALHDATRELMSAGDRESIAAAAVEAASEVLGHPGTGIRFHDPDRDILVNVSFGGNEAPKIDSRPPLPVDDTPHGQAFRTGETVVFDVTADEYGLEPFASVVSHGLRNPLNVADGNLELARAELREGGPAASVDDRLDRVDAALDRIDELARRAWAVTGGATTGATLVGADDLGTVACDPERVRTLFENLFRNAVEHGSTGDSTRSGAVDTGPGVTVTVGSLPERPGFFVADDGPGIPPAERDDVFDRGVSTGDGTGLGLAIVYEVVGAHAWSVEVTESAAGGARFEVVTD